MPSKDGLVPPAGLEELKEYAKLLTKAQQSGLNEATKKRGGLLVRPTV